MNHDHVYEVPGEPISNIHANIQHSTFNIRRGNSEGELFEWAGVQEHYNIQSLWRRGGRQPRPGMKLF